MSEFSETLKIMLDNTDLFNRAEWAYFTGSTTGKIEDWLNDRTIPKPYCLDMIWLALEKASDVDKTLLEPFWTMANKSAVEVSPLGKQMLPTVWEYFKRPAFSELSSKLAKLSLQKQEELLTELYLK